MWAVKLNTPGGFGWTDGLYVFFRARKEIANQVRTLKTLFCLYKPTLTFRSTKIRYSCH